MLASDAKPGLSSGAELALLGGAPHACLVVQRRACEDWFAVVARRRSMAAARAWIEAHYEGVRWRSDVLCTVLVGRVRPPR